ncbi:MAG: histidine triad nucleotide-binding protein [Rickettsiales bacterium]|nr:histidine triad nucleotide-binding protein [Rickettsiales bacterium]
MTEYDPQNIFARILRGEIPHKPVYEDDEILAFHDVNPAATVHVLVIPKGPYVSFDDFVQHTPHDRMARFFQRVQKIAAELGIDQTGYRLITNHGVHASQTVPHFHVHLLGGRSLGALLSH